MTEPLTAFKQKRDEIGTKALADSLGIKDSAVRMICTGHYPNPKNILSQFAKRYIDVVTCPHTGEEINQTDCALHHSGPRPFGGPSKQIWWDACQHCEHKS